MSAGRGMRYEEERRTAVAMFGALVVLLIAVVAWLCIRGES